MMLKKKNRIVVLVLLVMMGILSATSACADEIIYEAESNEMIYALASGDTELLMVTSQAVYRFNLQTRQMVCVLEHDDDLIDISCDGNTTLILARDGTIYALSEENELMVWDVVEEASLFAFTPLRLTHVGKACFVLVLDSETLTNCLLYKASENAPWVVCEGVTPLDVAACGEGEAYLLLQDDAGSCVGRLDMAEARWELAENYPDGMWHIACQEQAAYVLGYEGIYCEGELFTSCWQPLDLVVTEKSLYFITTSALMTVNREAPKETVPLIVSNPYALRGEYSNQYWMQTGIQIQAMEDVDMAQALLTQDGTVDIFMMYTLEGLANIKKGHYYTGLNSSDVLMAQTEKMYGAIRNALFDGEVLMAWPVWTCVSLGSRDSKQQLESLGYAYPTTFDEYLDVAKALRESDWWDDVNYNISGRYAFCQEEQLIYLITRYLLEAEASGVTPDFDTDTFRRLTLRIRAEVPREAAPPVDIATSMLDMESYAYETISDRMLPPMCIDPSHQGAAELQMMVAIVNPYSDNQAEAVAFLEYLAQIRDAYSYIIYQLPPMQDEATAARVSELEAQRDALLQEAAAGGEKARDARDEAGALSAQIARLQSSAYIVSPEALETYAEIANGYVVQETEALFDNETMTRYIRMYLNDVVTLDEFISRLNEHIAMEREE